jgi:hypothetical protein
MVERKQFASGGRYTRLIPAFKLRTAPMKEGFW